MNYFPLKEIVSNLQNPQNSTDDDRETSNHPGKVTFPKKAFGLASIGFFVLILALSITLGITVSNNKQLKSQTENLQKFENLTKFMSTISNVHQQLLNTAVLEDEFDLMELLLQNQPANKTIAQNHTDEALFLAVELNKFRFVKTLISYGANVSSRNELFEPPIHFVQSNDMLQLLINHGADSNAVTHDGRSALHMANHAEAVNILIQNGANVSIKSKSAKITPLMFAAFRGNFEVVEVLIENGANVSTTDKNSKTALHFAVGGPFDSSFDLDKARVAKILIQHGAQVDARTNELGTPLHYCSKDGYIEVAKVLLENGANVDAKIKGSDTPLYFAKDGEMAKLLIDNGANVTARNDDYETPLHYTKDVGVAEVLIENGIDVDIREKDNDTRLCKSVRKKEIEMAKVLLKNGADFNAECRYGIGTPLQNTIVTQSNEILQLFLENDANVDDRRDNQTLIQKASEYGNLDAVKLLIKHEANVNAASNESLLTSLHYVANSKLFFLASRETFAKIAEILIENGAIVDAKDKDSKTPLHYAAENEQTGFKVAKVLLNHGAEINAKSQEGKTPLELAKEFKNIQIEEFLTNYTKHT